MKYFTKSAALLFLSTSIALSYAQKVTPDQRAKYPCLDKVSGSAEDSVVPLGKLCAMRFELC